MHCGLRRTLALPRPYLRARMVLRRNDLGDPLLPLDLAPPPAQSLAGLDARQGSSRATSTAADAERH